MNEASCIYSIAFRLRADHTMGQSCLLALESSGWWSICAVTNSSIVSLQAKLAIPYCYIWSCKTANAGFFLKSNMAYFSGWFAGWWSTYHIQMNGEFKAHENPSTTSTLRAMLQLKTIFLMRGVPFHQYCCSSYRFCFCA